MTDTSLIIRMPRPFSVIARGPIRRRLWLGAGCAALFIATVAVVYLLMPKSPDRAGMTGTDFIAFYTGGTFVREGRSRELYDLHAVSTFQHDLAHQRGDDLGQAIGPWWNPPYYAWVFVPFSALSYGSALTLWIVCNVICAAIAATILAKWVKRAIPSPGTPGEGQGEGFDKSAKSPHPNPLPEYRERERIPASAWALVPVLMVLSTPFIHALTHAQNACTSLLLLTLVVAAWRRERPVVAGLLLGLLAYKPQLAALVAVIMTICLGWRVLAGLAISGVALLGITLLTLPGTLGDYQQKLPLNLHFVQFEVPYLWDRHVTFRAFWRLLFQGYAVGENKPLTMLLTAACCIGLGALLFSAAMRAREARFHLPANGRRFDRIIAATIVATPLLMPFYFDYDQLLLAIPAALFAVEMLESRQKGSSLIVGLWSAWYAWLMVNPDVASMTHVNVTVILLAALGTALAFRATRATSAAVLSIDPPSTELRALAA